MTMVTPTPKSSSNGNTQAQATTLGVVWRMIGPSNNPIEKTLLIASAYGISHVIHSTFETKHVPIYCMLFAGFLSNILGFRMSLFRVAGTLGSNELKTTSFQKWSRVQLNNAEWAPIIMILQLAIHVLSGGSPTKNGATACLFANMGTIFYCMGNLVFFGDVVDDNPGVGHRLPPFRFAGASIRYLAVFLMVYECTILVA
mmetsp:Transcript_6665/g.11171  ORF Transcript_6665/g.11171 Transcript_6665/m.11171 type:complete len:200 (-) Transcript_6665:55-654(-)